MGVYGSVDVFVGGGLIFLFNQWIGCAAVPSARRPKFGFAGLRNYFSPECVENLLRVHGNLVQPLANALKSLGIPSRRKENHGNALKMRIPGSKWPMRPTSARIGSRQKRIEVDARI